MRTWLATFASQGKRFGKFMTAGLVMLMVGSSSLLAQSTEEVGGEAGLKLPDLSQVSFLGVDGHKLLMIGLVFCVMGLGFGMAI